MGSCQSKKALKAALKKRRMEKISKGQRASSGDGTTKLPKRQANSQQTSTPCSSSSASAIETPAHTPNGPEAGTTTIPTKGKKVFKTALKETSTRKAFHLKSNCSSNSIPSNDSSATLHGRVLQKTSTVSPAPSKTTGSNSHQNLPRFGFKNSSVINSGDSTDSVNSILSDAQTTSDANSNLFDFGEEGGNVSSELSDKLIPVVGSENTPTLTVRSVSPCTISQASSGVTSSLLNGKFKAQTRQLPSPQTVTVKEMNNNKKKQSSPNGSLKLRHASPSSKKVHIPHYNSSAPSKDNRSKIPQNVKPCLSKTQKLTKEVESSNRSISTIDSGLGSSLESDKLRSPKALTSDGDDKVIDTGQGAFSNVADIHLDVSDEWLKDKHSRLGLEINSNGHSKLLENSLTQKAPGKIQKDTFKDKRDSNITYGMARQKFAPYSRYRYNYQNNINKAHSHFDKNVSKSDVLSQTKAHFTGVVRNRIAQLEKTPSKIPANLPFQKTPKKSVTRPTSIEKTPILVNSKMENNIELSRSICKRLEYNEGKKGSFLEHVIDNKSERKTSKPPTIVQDLLMVDSVEVKKKSLDSDDEQTSPSKMFVNFSDKIKDSICENSEQKRIRDIVECENATKRLSDEAKLNSDALLHLPLPDSSAKVFSPDGSETSFEVLESGSVDCSPREEAALSVSNEAYLNHLVAGLAKSSDSLTLSKPFQNLSENTTFEKSQGTCNNEDSTTTPEECSSQADTGTVVNNEHSDNLGNRSKSVMESSVESGRTETNRTADNMDRWTVSGKCTPSIGSTRGDADQDFLIDDEISDQPGLTFGDDLDASLFGDEDLFSDISSTSATNVSKTGRSRQGSFGTTASSLGPDDLMLDYDLEESKPYGCKRLSKGSEKSLNSSNSKKSPRQTKNKKVEISLPGSRYDEEVLSPVACDILSEWSAILSGTQSPSPMRTTPEPCVSQQTTLVNTVCSSSLSSCTQSQSTNVTTHQPLREENPLSPEGNLSSRSRAFSVGADVPLMEVRKGLSLKPPRQEVSSERDCGLNIDRRALHYICEDVSAMKTLLLRLRRVLQVTDTINPFDANLKTSLYLNLGVNDPNEKEDPTSTQDVVQQNVDLKRQVVLLQQRLEEKDRTIRSLQQQLTQSLQKSTSSAITPTSSSSCLASSYISCGDDDMSNISSSEKSLSNAATQTERNSHRSSPYSLASMSRTSSVEDGFGPTVSFEDLTSRRSGSETANIVSENSTDQNEEKEEEDVTDINLKKNYSPEIPVGITTTKLSLVSTTTPVTSPLAPS